jgi:hypothetical protein
MKYMKFAPLLPRILFLKSPFPVCYFAPNLVRSTLHPKSLKHKAIAFAQKFHDLSFVVPRIIVCGGISPTVFNSMIQELL